jgi:hypothetical protein
MPGSNFGPEALVGSVVAAPFVPTAANILSGIVIGQGAGTTTIITIPAGRTWQGEIDVSCACDNAAAAVGEGRQYGNISLSGAGSSPPPGNLFEVRALAGANAATGTVGSQGNNFGKWSGIIVAGANPVLVQLISSGAGTTNLSDASASGVLIA